MDDPSPLPATQVAAALDLWRAAGSVGRLPVSGGSMRPTLAAGETVRVRAGPVRIGEIAVARRPDGDLTVHRLIGRRGGQVFLRGDDSALTDPPLSPAALLGRVVAVEGLAGRRLDGRAERVVGLGAAAYARVQWALGHRPRRPRPRAIPRVAARLRTLVAPTIDPEAAFVLLTARPQPSEVSLGQASDLARRGLDWEPVVGLALRGQLGPPVYRALGQLPAGTVPETARAALQGQYLGNLLRSEEQAGFLRPILARLGAEGIPVLAHKGLALRLTVYSDPGLRIAGDIDLSVPDEHRARAEALVADIRQALVAANPDRRSQRGHHVELDGTVHHDLDPVGQGGGRWAAGVLDWVGIWARARPLDFAGQPLLVPGAEDLVLTLVANAIRRGFSPPRLVLDLAAALARFGAELDWERLAAALGASRLDRRAWLALGLARDWFGAEIPARFLEPPPDLTLTAWEGYLLAHKHRHPFARLPTRVLWAGSTPAAAGQAWRLWRSGRR